MSAIGAWSRRELRTRWRSLVLLAVLVAFAGGTVLTAVAGARRGSSAVDRLIEDTLPADALVLPNQSGFDWDRIRAFPEVAALTTFVVTGYGVKEIPPEEWEDSVSFPPGDDEVWRTIERPAVLAGRVPDPTRADEVAVSARFRAERGLGVGDSVTLLLAEPAATDQANSAGNEAAPEGPEVKATIVGVLRSPWFSDQAGSPKGAVLVSPGLFAHYADNLLGAQRSGFVNALVRLRDGEAGLPAFKQRLEAVTGRDDIDVSNLAEGADHARDVTGFEANCLLAFALAAAVASLFLVGQAVSRYAGGAAAELQVLRAIGLSPRHCRMMAMVGPAAAGVLGGLGGAGAAYAASRWFPVGTAANYEPAPGRFFDVLLVAGAVALALLVAAGAWLAAAAAMRVRSAPARTPAAVISGLLARAPAPVAVGARLAVDGGRGRQSVPVRPAFVGAIVGVAGVVGALTFSAGVADATTNLARFGQSFDVVTFLGFNSDDFVPARDVLGQVAADKDVVAVNDARVDVAQSGDVGLSLYTLDPVGDQLDFVVTEGRLPSRDGEVALGPRTARALHVEPGDTVELAGPKGRDRFQVTGLAFVPAGPHNDYAGGGWIQPTGYDRLFGDAFKFHFGLVGTARDTDPEQVAARISKDTEFDFQAGPIIPPAEQAELRQVKAMPLALAAFLALLAVAAVGHTLASTVRRRRHDLAVFRALGLTGRDIRLAVVTQASVIAVVGFVLGVPLGAALGRTVWGVVADSTPVAHLAPTAWLAVIVTPVVAVAAANLLAAWPAHRAATVRVGQVLRAD